MTIHEFMSRARQVEVLVYRQQTLCNQLQNTLEGRKRKQNRELTSLIPEHPYAPRSAQFGFLGRLICTCLGGIAGFAGYIHIREANIAQKYAEYKAAGIPIHIGAIGASDAAETIGGLASLAMLIIGFFIGWAIDYIYYKVLVSEDREKDAIVDLKNIEIRKQNLSISQSNDLIKKRHQTQNIALQQEIQKAKNVLRNIEKMKEEFYKKAPYYIHPKYQDIVAITTFENYLATRRCTELDGYMGVFNVYEQDLQFGLIMTKMDAIIDRLDTISAYQSALVSLARQTNNEIGRLTNLVDVRTRNISAQLSNIEESADMARYYSKVNAEIQTYRLLVDTWK